MQKKNFYVLVGGISEAKAQLQHKAGIEFQYSEFRSETSPDLDKIDCLVTEAVVMGWNLITIMKELTVITEWKEDAERQALADLNGFKTFLGSAPCIAVKHEPTKPIIRDESEIAAT